MKPLICQPPPVLIVYEIIARSTQWRHLTLEVTRIYPLRNALLDHRSRRPSAPGKIRLEAFVPPELV